MQPALVVATATCAACASTIVTAHMKKKIDYVSCARDPYQGKSISITLNNLIV
jgi:hypothetical protein